MGRFTASKYKNAAAKKLKREDTAFGFRIGELCQNDPIACGADKVAFTGEAAGVSILDTGELGNVQPRSLRGHHEYVRCLEFNPFNKLVDTNKLVDIKKLIDINKFILNFRFS